MNKSKRNELFFLLSGSLIFFTVFKPPGFDPDYYNYLSLFEKTYNMVISHDYMFIYSLISFYSYKYNIGFFSVLIIYGAFGFYLKYYVISKFEDKLFLLLSYILWCYFIYDITTIRVSLALGIVLFGMYQTNCGKGWYKYILLACAVHISCVLFFVSISNIRIKGLYNILILIVMMLVGIFLSNDLIYKYFIDLLTQIPIAKVQIYIDLYLSRGGESLSIFSPSMMFVFMIYSIYILWLSPKRKNKTEFEVTISNMIFFGLSSYFLLFLIPVFAVRISQLFLFFFPFFIVYVISYFNKNVTLYIKFLFVIVGVIYFYRFIYMNEIYNWSSILL